MYSPVPSVSTNTEHSMHDEELFDYDFGRSLAELAASMRRSDWRASSIESMMSTPLPAARPSALSIGASRLSRKASPSAMLSGVTVRYLAVGMPYFAIKCLAKSFGAFEGGSCLARVDHEQLAAFGHGAAFRNSRRPSTSGSSFPATTRSISFDTTASYTASKSVGFIGRLVPKADVPALPGAMKNFAHTGALA